MNTHAGTLAIVTPTFLPDLARCELLVESVRRFAPRADHFLVVDRRETAAFAHLAGPRTTLVSSEELLPRGSRRLPTRRSWWWTPVVVPARGWIVQQALKMALAAQLDHEVCVMCDSDVCLVGPFDLAETREDGRTTLIDVDEASADVRRWTAVAARLLGVEPPPRPRNHVGNLVNWRPEHVRSLIRRLEDVADRDWRRVVLGQLRFSEYVLYGVYVRCILGEAAGGYTARTVEYCHASWSWDLDRPGEIDRFFDALEPHHRAVMVHSKSGIEPDGYRARVERAWAGADRPGGPT